MSVRFGGVTALAGITFTVTPGTVTAIIGPNGAGKTTAFNTITGYLRPTGGEVRWEGASITRLRPHDIARRGIVRTFQKTSVFPALTVHENVMVGLHLRGTGEWTDALVGRAHVREEERQLAALAHDLCRFVGLAHRGGETAGGLPYGDQRLLELAIALGARPKLLLLDEPAAGMTGTEKDTVSRLIRRVRDEGVTVLLVEHDMRVVMGISDRVIVLNHGRLIADGPPAEIQRHSEVIRAYLGSSAVAGADRTDPADDRTAPGPGGIEPGIDRIDST